MVQTYNPIVVPLQENLIEIRKGDMRRIHVLLPFDYYKRQDQKYPVLYLHDAQNLFGQGSPFGNWAIDSSMSKLASQGRGGIIIVAIDHGGEHRIEEFNPYPGQHIGKSTGREYIDQLTTRLKPFIDKNFRTLPGRIYTGMGGSSMGGLITIYGGLMYPHIFGKLMIFSPSLWAAPKIYFDAIRFISPYSTDIYLYAGKAESKYMVPNVQRFKRSLERQGFANTQITFHLSIDDLGQHNEARWGKEFPIAIEWLFFQNQQNV